jgi:hypothetical protein
VSGNRVAGRKYNTKPFIIEQRGTQEFSPKACLLDSISDDRKLQQYAL